MRPTFASVVGFTALTASVLVGLAAAPVSSRAASTPATAQATLLAETPGLLRSHAYPSSVHLSTATNWTWSYNQTDGLAAVAQKGSDSFGFSLTGAVFTAATHGAKKVHLEISLNGATCGNAVNADIRDFAVDKNNQVQRLDAVFAILCSDSAQSGYVIGEFAYGESPTEPVSSWPGELYLPPSSPDSTKAEFPVHLFHNGTGSTTIAKAALQGGQAGQFAITKNGCIGHTVTSSASCAVDIRYDGKRSEASTTLVATTGSGAVVCRTPIDGARLPGRTYWATTDPEYHQGTKVESYRPGPTTQMGIAGSRPKTRNLQLFLTTGNQAMAGEFIFRPAKRLHVGTYHLNKHGAPIAFQYLVGGSDRSAVPGTVRILQVGFTRTDRGHERLPAFAFTFELKPKGSTPTYGAVGYLTSRPRRVPGFTTPPVLRQLHAHGRGTATTVLWHASPDVSVHRYVVLAKAGAQPAVPWGGGNRLYSGATPHFGLGHRHAGRPLTLSVFAVDDRGHHSRGRTIVLRR